jgi:hypothetical protein
VNRCHPPWKCLRALQTWASRETRVVGKVYNLCRVKTDISAVLMVKSGLDPHMIIKLKDDLNHWFYFFIDVLWIVSSQTVYLRAGIHLHLANACLIKT